MPLGYQRSVRSYSLETDSDHSINENRAFISLVLWLMLNLLHFMTLEETMSRHNIA